LDAHSVPPEIAGIFSVGIVFKYCSDNMLYYAQKENVVYINWALFTDKTIEKAAHQILSFLMTVATYDTTPLVGNMLSVFRQQHAAQPLSPPPPPEVHSLTSEEVVNNNNNNKHVHPKKRERSVVPPAPAPAPATAPAPAPVSLLKIDRSQLSTAPPGTKYIYTWCLVEDK
jgi:hypothetical protein